MKAQFERWPAEYKFAVDQDVVVLFAYPSPIIDWAGFAFINHISSVSSVTLGKPVSIIRADGTVVPAWPDREETVFGERLIVWRSYNTGEGNARLEAVLADAELMQRILEGPPAVSPTPTPTASPRQVTIVPGVVLETYANSNWGLLWTRDGQVHLRGDGNVNYCNFRTEEGRRLLKEILADEEAMARIRAYLKEWDLVGKPVDLPMGLGMQAPAEVQPGTEAILKVSIYSNSDCPVEYPLGGPTFDFAVTRLDGTELWRWSQDKTAGDPTSLRLGEREERAFEAEWDLHDKEGSPLPEGAYWVQGYLNIGLESGATPAMHPTGKRLLFIGPRLPLTDWLEAWLEVPQEAKAGEPVALNLKLRNRSNEPVQIFHGSGPFDFVILREDGREVWRWSRWKVFTSELRNTTLQPAETLTYDITWDQHDQDCQPDPGVYGRPCSGNSVSPGRYSVHATFVAALSGDYAEYMETIQVGPNVLEVLP